MTTQNAVGDILKNLICDNSWVIEAPITAEKVEIIKNIILQQPMFEGISLPSISDEMILKIAAGGSQCKTAIDGLVKDIEGTSLKEDFNDIVSDGKMIDDVLGAIKDATCNCSPVVSECTPIIAYLEQIRKANLEMKEKITLTKTDGKNKLSNDTDWVSALNGIEISGKCFKLSLDFKFNANSKEFNPNAFKETKDGFEFIDENENTILSIKLLGVSGQEKFLMQAILKKHLELKEKKENIIPIMRIYSSDRSIVLSVPKNIEVEFNNRYQDMANHQQAFPIKFEYYNSSGDRRELGQFNYIMTENQYLGQDNYGTTPLIDLIDIQQFSNIAGINLNLNTERYYPNLRSMASFLGIMLEYQYTDFTFNGCSNEEGLSIGGSSSHKNGYNCDIRYLRTDYEVERSNICGANYTIVDTERHIDLNNGLIEYGWGYLLSNHTKIELHRTHNDPDGRHCDHLHLQSYRPNFSIIYE